MLKIEIGGKSDGIDSGFIDGPTLFGTCTGKVLFLWW